MEKLPIDPASQNILISGNSVSNQLEHPNFWAGTSLLLLLCVQPTLTLAILRIVPLSTTVHFDQGLLLGEFFTCAMIATVAVFAILFSCAQSFAPVSRIGSASSLSNLHLRGHVSSPLPVVDFKMAGDEKPSPKEGYEWLKEQLEKVDESKPKVPPIYVPGPFTQKLVAAAAYLVPIVDSSDLGKYMFEAYPEIGSAYNTVFGPVAAIYNGVPFLPFAVFFLMSYISRAPNFPVEIRFHFAQAFVVSLIQVIPSLVFPFLEKAGVPFMGVAYNSGIVFNLNVTTC